MERREFIRQLSMMGISSTVFPSLNLNSMMNTGLTKSDFGDDFKWGVATAAYQIEGAYNIDGKGLSIWDVYANKKKSKSIKDRTNGNVACDFYHRYKEDIKNVKDMNFDVFRFSTSWARILPEGIGKVNQKGIDFYHKVIDECLEQGIEPWITLYHWDLPQALQEKGGWANRDVIDWFAEYSDVVTKNYGDKVKNWMVLNEPAASTTLGHLAGIHAPAKIAPKKFLASVHHTTMCQAEGARIIRRNVKDANIGTTFSASHVTPKNDKAMNVRAAHRMNILLNRLFIEPALGMGYPTEGWKFIAKIKRYIKEGDMEKLAFNFDFIGVQNYTQMIATHSLIPFVWAFEVSPKKRGVLPENMTDMGWEVYPEGIYKVLKQFNEYKNLPPIIVTENGCAFPDKVENGRVHDLRRIKFFQDYLVQVLRAKKEGMDIRGYYVWTLMDNFEWQEGYVPRFGLVHVDFETQKRTMKDSGLWFKEFLK
ncbi:MAG: beta-glucosidase [Maribacter sp.]|jgi:beta-glucosidase